MPSRTHALAVVLLAVLSVVAAACGGDRGPSTATPSGGPGMVDATGDWVLTRGTRDGVAIPLVPGADITMTVGGSQISGRAACNQYGGEIIVTDGQVRFGPMFMTEMACDEPTMASEAAYLAALGQVRTADLAGATLTLSGPGVDLVFERTPPPPTAELVGTAWVLDTLFTADAASSVMGDPATLVLAADGSFTASTGCRPIVGRYDLADGVLTFSPAAMEQVRCDPALADQDQHVRDVLGGNVQVAIDGGRLTLRGPAMLGLGYTTSEP